MVSDEQRDSSEALQLFLRLLSNEERDELHHLFSFLYIVQGEHLITFLERLSNWYLFASAREH